MTTRLLHLIFFVCAFHLVQVQSGCPFIHTDGREWVRDAKNCSCGPEKIPEVNKTTGGPEKVPLRNKTTGGPNSNSPKIQMKIIHHSQDTSSISM